MKARFSIEKSGEVYTNLSSPHPKTKEKLASLEPGIYVAEIIMLPPTDNFPKKSWVKKPGTKIVRLGLSPS